MPQRSSNLEAVRLSLEILKKISRYREVTSAELKDQLAEAGINRDIRTIQRTLKFLVDNFSIECSEGKPRKYKWKEKAKGLLIPSLGENEALMLALAERHLQTLLPQSSLPSLDSVLHTANSLLEEKRGAHGAWMNKVRNAYPTPVLIPPRIDDEVLEEVSKCLFENLKLRLKYQNRSGEIREHIVMPVGLVNRAQVLYLIVMYDDFKTPYRLAIHRMKSAQAMTISFEPPQSFDIDDCIETYGFSPGHLEPVILEFFIKENVGQHLTESKLSEDQTCESLDSELHIKATVRDSVELRHWLRGFGNDIRDVRMNGSPFDDSELRWTEIPEEGV